MSVSQSYGITRPAAIAAKVAALQARFSPVVIEAPVLALIPAAPSKAARLASMQAERAAIRSDLPTLRAAAIEAAYLPEGEAFAVEIAALESRLEDLDDCLIFEPDAAETFDALPLAA